MDYKKLVSYLLASSIAMCMAMSAQGATVLTGGWRFAESGGHAQDFDVHPVPGVHPTWDQFVEPALFLADFDDTASGGAISGDASSSGSSSQTSTLSTTLIDASGASSGTVTIFEDHGRSGNTSELNISFSVDTLTPFLIQGSIFASGSINASHVDTALGYGASVDLVDGASTPIGQWQLFETDGSTTFSLSGVLDPGSYTIAAIAYADIFIDDNGAQVGPPWVGTASTEFDFTLQIGAVPVPAAVWLFGSGLIGLVGVARRKKA